MSDLIQKLVDLSLGVAAASKEKAEAVVDELVKRGEVSREAGDKVAEELAAKGEAARSELTKTIETKLEEILERLNLATKQDLDALELRIAALERRSTDA